MTTPVNSTDTTNLLNQVNQRDKTTTSEGVQDRFLKLLITQMQNQDPLNPLDNAQVTTQLAQISTVSGIDKLNSTVTSMTSSLLAAQQMQAGGLIGHAVLAPGKTMELKDSKAVGAFQLAEAADQTTINIKTAAGVTVKTYALDKLDAGIHTFSWDGTDSKGNQVADGKYVFEVSAIHANQNVTADTLGYGVVQSVTLGANSLQLNTSNLGGVAMTDVKQIQ